MNKIKSMYLNLSIKYKILVFFYAVVVFVSIVLGYYSYSISESYVVNKISTAKLEVVKQINSNINFLQKDILDISTFLTLDYGVQSLIKSTNSEKKEVPGSVGFTSDNPLSYLMNLVASKSYISSVLIYANEGPPLSFTSTDMSSGGKDISSGIENEIFQRSRSMQGSPVWFLINNENPVFIQYNKYPKIAMGRTIKNLDNFNEAGFIVLCVNEHTIRNMYINNIQSNQESIVIVDDTGRIVSSDVSPDVPFNNLLDNILKVPLSISEGYFKENFLNKDMLVAYSGNNLAGWKILYFVPLNTLTGEINSIKSFTLFVILACLLFSLPIIFLVSTLLTAPIKKLLKSMKRFQEGNFNEKVDFKYDDEIGELGRGYNNMVANIKELIDRAYILQIREREAELNALQAQINPHFLYNTLDTIFWKAQSNGEKEISEMVYSLSRLFRLSLNKGKSFTSVACEKELVEHYLLLQRIRFKSKLNYEIDIESRILDYTIPKLILQPFVENAILHGIEKKENGGTVKIKGYLKENKLHFVIEDDGVGMDEYKLNNILCPKADNETEANSSVPSGGYAVKNVNERLKLIFNSGYSLKFTSKPDKGTKVEITVPTAIPDKDRRRSGD